MRTISYLATLTFLTSPPASAVVTFVEDFDDDSANWRDTTGAFVVNWSDVDPAPGGSAGYATVPFSFTEAGSFGAVIFRGHSAFGSSGGAFAGDWVADAVQRFSVLVRHDAPTPLPFNVRFAAPANFPGTTAVEFVPVLPHTWTELSFQIDPASPNFVTFEGTDFDTVFSNIGNVQIGTSVPDGFENDPTVYNFDIDQVTVTVPEPGAPLLALLGGGLLAGRRRRS